METRTYTVYKFDELSDDAKEKAIQNLYDINVDHEWWESTCDDARTIGLSITSFDIGRGSYCKGKFISSAESCIEFILKEHGKTCGTYALATEWKDKLDTESETYKEQCEEFLNSLLEEYLSLLRQDYQYLISEAAIIETIKANDYDFTEDGKID